MIWYDKLPPSGEAVPKPPVNPLAQPNPLDGVNPAANASGTSGSFGAGPASNSAVTNAVSFNPANSSAARQGNLAVWLLAGSLLALIIAVGIYTWRKKK